jgi:hypothetical protein
MLSKLGSRAIPTAFVMARAGQIDPQVIGWLLIYSHLQGTVNLIIPSVDAEQAQEILNYDFGGSFSVVQGPNSARWENKMLTTAAGIVSSL